MLKREVPRAISLYRCIVGGSRHLSVYSIHNEQHAAAAVASLTQFQKKGTHREASARSATAYLEYPIISFLGCYNSSQTLFRSLQRQRQHVDIVVFRKDAGLFCFDTTVPSVMLHLERLFKAPSIIKVTRHADELFSLVFAGNRPPMHGTAVSGKERFRDNLWRANDVVDLQSLSHPVGSEIKFMSPALSFSPVSCEANLLTPLPSIIAAYGLPVDQNVMDRCKIVRSLWDTIRAHISPQRLDLEAHLPLPSEGQRQTLACVLYAMESVARECSIKARNELHAATPRFAAPGESCVNVASSQRANKESVTSTKIFRARQVLQCRDVTFYSLEDDTYPLDYVGVRETRAEEAKKLFSSFTVHYVNHAQRLLIGAPQARCISQLIQRVLEREKAEERAAFVALEKKQKKQSLQEGAENRSRTTAKDTEPPPIMFDQNNPVTSDRSLPRIGELIYRRGKKPKVRTSLPEGIWDAQGRLLPSPGTPRDIVRPRGARPR